MGTRLEFQDLLESVLGSPNVYFQPPTSTVMEYPAIVYNRDALRDQFADNLPYLRRTRYQVTVIDPDPDSLIPDKVAALPLSAYDRHFTADQLNHDIYNVYY
jgi:hypothetical protein